MAHLTRNISKLPSRLLTTSAPIQLGASILMVLALALATHSLVPGFILLVLWALHSPRGAVQALSLTWLLVAINPNLLPLAPEALVMRWPVLLAGLVSTLIVWIRRRTPRYPTVFWLLIFLGVASTSAATSGAPFTALGKLAVFGAGVLTLLLAAHFTAHLAGFWYDWFTAILFSVVLLAIPLIFLDVGYMALVVGRGFRGLLNHSQSTGVFLAIAIPFFFARVLTSRRPVWPSATAGLLALVSLFLTGSRGAVLAAVVGLAAVIGVGFMRNRTHPGTLSASRAVAVLVPLVLLLTIFWGNIQEPATDFILKRNVGSVISSISTRTALAESSIEGFHTNPLLGIGFGLASDAAVAGESQESRSAFTAPVEKGFLPAALLEWTGLVGTMVFLVFFVTLMVPILRFARIEIVGAVVAAIATNGFEATLLSIGGMGMLIWLVLFWGFVDSMRGPDRLSSVKESEWTS